MVNVVMPSAPVVGVALENVQANAVIGATIVPAVGTILIVENGEHDISRYKTAVVNVPVPQNYGEIIWNGNTLTVR